MPRWWLITFAAVPLYRLYVKATGYGGIGRSAAAMPGAVLKRKVTLEFDSNTSPDLPWTFKPVQGAETIRIGEVGRARFHVQNNAKTPLTAVASFNILPFAAAAYISNHQMLLLYRANLGRPARPRISRSPTSLIWRSPRTGS